MIGIEALKLLSKAWASVWYLVCGKIYFYRNNLTNITSMPVIAYKPIHIYISLRLNFKENFYVHKYRLEGSYTCKII